MRLNFYTLFVFTLFVNTAVAQSQSLKINEVMASNTTTLASDLGNFGDWIEIYNPNGTIVDLGGMFITDDLTLPTKYQFPLSNAATIIPANGFKLVWADDSAQILHTNFKLSGTLGETIALFAADGVTLIDSVSFGAQTADVSYGRSTDGSPTWITFNPSTPEATNNATTIQKNLNNAFAFEIFPNPVQNQLMISTPGCYDIMITDMNGKLVLQGLRNQQNMIDVSALQKGNYLIVAQQNGLRVCKTFSKN